jgi:hypothetical protein
MNSDAFDGRPIGSGEFLDRYNYWRKMYALRGISGPQEPFWDGNRLILREGFPGEGWGGFIIEPEASGYNVSAISTERRAEPLLSLLGYFSTFALAGKFIIWNIGENLRVRCRISSLELLWSPATLAPGVRAVSLAKYRTRYELIANPSAFLVFEAGGIQPENHLLTLSFEALERALEDGLPVPTVDHS